MEVMLFNCPEWGIAVSAITILGAVYLGAQPVRLVTVRPVAVSCDSIVTVCVPVSTNSPVITLQLTPDSTWMHLAGVEFYGSQYPSCSSQEPSPTAPCTDSVVTTPPHTTLTSPPNTTVTTFPHKAVNTPHTAMTTPPHTAVTTLPHTAVTTPPHTAMTTPPHTAVTTPPHTAVTTPPPIAMTTLPHTAVTTYSTTTPHTALTTPPHVTPPHTVMTMSPHTAVATMTTPFPLTSPDASQHADQTRTEIEGESSSTGFPDTTQCEGLSCSLTVLLSSVVSTAIVTALLVTSVVLVAVCFKKHTRKIMSEGENEPVYEEVSERRGEETAWIILSAHFKAEETYELDENEAYCI